MPAPPIMTGIVEFARPRQAQARKGRTMIVWVLVFAALMAGINIYASHLSQSVLAKAMPVMNQVDDLQQNLARLGLAYANYTHDPNPENLWTALDDARLALERTDESSRTLIDLQSTTTLPARPATPLVSAFHALEDTVRERAAGPRGETEAAALDARFDEHMNAVFREVRSLHHRVGMVIEQQVARTRNTAIFLDALFAAIVVIALWLLRRHDAMQRDQDLTLRKLGQGIEQSPASIIITDPSGTIEYVNPHFEDVTGYTSAEVIGQNPRILQSGEMDPSFYADLWKTITSGEVWHGEFLNRRKNGELIWEHASISPIRDEAGAIRNYVAVKEDVTQRKSDEQKLQQSRELFSRAFHSNPALIALSEPGSGRHVDVNESWCKTLKYTRDEAIGKTAFEMDLWPNVEDRERILAELKDKGRLRNFDTRLKARDGTLIDCLISTEPIVMDERELVLWSANDISLRRRSERESEYRRVLFEAIFNGIPDAIVYADPSRAIVQVNPGLEKIFGYEAAELRGQKALALYASEDEYERQGRLRFNLSAEKKLEPYVVNYRRKDGTSFPGETLGTSITDADGNALGFIGVIRDITERTRIEGQLIQAKEEAEYANYAKTQFLANMSHELRTPLNAILGFAEMISMEAFGPIGEPKYKEYVDDIAKSGQHLLDIIADILDISKIEAGHMELHCEETDVETLIHACLSILEAQAAGKDITIDVDVAPDLPHLDADPLRLKQIIINLLSNAIKFTDPKGRVEIDVFIAGDGRLTLIVTDTGVGIKEEDIAHVLKPFGQASEITIRAYEGSGLGLSLSKALMEMHGGELHVESAPDEGTAVSCQFPATRTLPISGPISGPIQGQE